MNDERVRAWIKPLKNGTWQFYARVGKDERTMGAAPSAEAAYDSICDYVYASEAYKSNGDPSWDIDWRT